MSMKRHNKQKKKQNRGIAAIVTASVLAVTLGTVGVFHQMQPIEAYAKESFTGTKQVVEGHTGDDNPFVILDIVPSYATYKWNGDETQSYQISTGTLGYLVNGQSTMASDYAGIYKDHSADLLTWQKRSELVNEIWKSGTGDSDLVFQYEEACGSGNTRKDLNTPNANGWQLLIEQETLQAGDQTTGATAHSGMMKGYFKKYETPDPDASQAATPDRTGYDYVKVGNWNEDEGSGESSDNIYQFDQTNGTYQLQFRKASGSGLTQGYVIKDTDPIDENNKDNYSSVTGVYYMDADSNFVYAGTIASVFRSNSISLDEYYSNPVTSSDSNSSDSNLSDSTPLASASTDAELTDTDEKTAEAAATATATSAATPTTAPASAVASATPTATTSTTAAAGTTSKPAATTAPDKAAATAVKTETTTVNNKINYAAYVPSVLYSELQQTTTPTPKAVPVTSPSTTDRNTDTDTNSESSDADNNNSNDLSVPQPVAQTGTGTAYYIVTFKYVTDIAADGSQTIYEVIPGSETEISGDTTNRPYDVYVKSGSTAEAGTTPSASADSSAEVSASLSVTPSASPSSTPDINTDKVFLYVGPGQGDYKLTDQADLSDADKKRQAPVWMEVRNAPTYFRFNGGCDWLKNYVFHALSGGDNANENFKIQVRTIRADELTQDMIEKADLVYLESGTASFIRSDSANVSLTYLRQDTQTVQRDGNSMTTGMTRENAYGLLYQAAVNLLPVIVDYQAATKEEYKDLDYQKVAKMFLKEDLENFVNDAHTDQNWMFEHLGDSGYPDRTYNGNHFVNRNVYMVNSSTPLVNGDFPKAFDEGSTGSGFSEVLNLIQSENALLSEDNRIPESVCKAKAIEYIINYSVGFIAEFTDLRIMELQPTNNDQADLKAENPTDNSTTLYWQRNATGSVKKQVLRSSRKVNVQVTTKTPSSFNSEWEDINQNYNLVFAGLDGQKLNYAAGLWSSIAYNDSNLNGKLYHTGDQAGGSDERYDASDITERKKQELLDFMKAGYPVLVENDFFNGKSAKNGADRINTKYVAADTQMYDFLKQATTDYADRIYTIDDVHSNILFLAQLNIDHPVIRVTDTADVTLSEALNGEFSVSFGYSITNQNGGSYDGECSTELYLDMNGDGNYTDAERVDNVSAEGNVIRAAADGGQMSILFTEDPGSRAIPFRLRVVDNGNTYRRSSVEGILTVLDTTKEKIRVLQIGDPDATSLSNLYQQENSTLGYYLKAAENTMNVKFDIETVSTAMLGEKLAKNPDYLEQWDLLIVGFGNGSENISSGRIEDYIQKGHSVLVTGKEATDGKRQMSTALLGQYENRKTYGKLGRDTGSLYRYAGLDAGMFGAQSNLSAVGLNTGSVFSYPYSIGKSAALDGGKSYQAYDYLLDLSSLKAPFVTPWFVFSQSGNNTNAYDVSPKDGANNYWLYSRSNVVFIGNDDYSGFTYQADNQQIPQGAGVQDCQMFVNAMMLAYDSGVHNLKVDIVAGFDTTAAKVASISIPFDKDLENQGESGLLDETVDVYFKFKNSNLTLSNAYNVNFYYEDTAGSVTLNVGDEVVQVTPFTSSLWTVQDNTLTEVAASQIRQGKVYRFKAPVIALQNNTAATNAKIYVEVVSALERPDGSEGAGSKEVRGYDSVTFTRTQLFLLE
jgi:hypothetical protein